MKLDCFFTLWGWQGTPQDAVVYAQSSGFDGVEGQCPADSSECELFARALASTGLKYIQEIPTTGTYVPDRSLPKATHLEHFANELHRAKEAGLHAEFINCLGGCDAWSDDDAVQFFNDAQAIADLANVVVSFETHRGRILFNPWRCLALCKRLPQLKLTFDVSHWAVVCEGLQETEINLIRQLEQHAHHIHARVGYDQGPQVPTPFKGVYKKDYEQHLKIWQSIWAYQQDHGASSCTVTPEFGIDGYEYRSEDGERALVDPQTINQQMMEQLRAHFAQQLAS